MKLAHLSDLHVREGVHLPDQRALLLRLADRFVQEKIDAILLTGDLYGRAVPHRSTPAEREALLAFLVAVRPIPVVIVCGNHDVDVDLAGLGALEHVQVATRPQVVGVISPWTHDGAHVYCLPYPWRGWLHAGHPARGILEGQTTLDEAIRTLVVGWAGQIKRQRDTGAWRTQIVAAHILVDGARTSGGEVLVPNEVRLAPADLDLLGASYVALGHLHQPQRVSERGFYAGSPWFTDHGERNDEKSWNLVTIGDIPSDAAIRLPDHPDCDDVAVELVPTDPRPVRTLDWRWAAATTSDRPSWRAGDLIATVIDPIGVGAPTMLDPGPQWTKRPSEEEIAACAGAEVRCRVSVPQTWVASMPWAEELARVKAAGAWRVLEERSIEPVLRARAPEVAAQATPEGKLAPYWSTLATQPSEAEKASAREALRALRAEPDDGTLAEQLRSRFRGAGHAV